jgi:hypothetical protein
MDHCHLRPHLQKDRIRMNALCKILYQLLDRLEAHRSRSLVLLLGLALLARMAAVFLAPTWYTTDSFVYQETGKAILAGAPVSRMPNGLPLLEAALIGTLGDAHIYAILTINVLLGTLACWLIFRIADRNFGARSAWAALALAALYPHTLNYVRFELTETISIFLLLLAIWSIGARKALLAGTAIGLLCLFRSSMLPSGVLLFAAAAYWQLAGPGWRPLALHIAGWSMVLGLNLALEKSGVIAPPSNMGSNLVLATRANSTAGIPFMTANLQPEELEHPVRHYLRFAIDHPGTWIGQRLSSLWELLGPWPGGGGLEQARGPATRAMIGLRFLFVLLALFALWRLRHPHGYLLAAPLLGLVVLHTLFFSEPRFLVPAEPLLLLLASALLCPTTTKRKHTNLT